MTDVEVICVEGAKGWPGVIGFLEIDVPSEQRYSTMYAETPISKGPNA